MKMSCGLLIFGKNEEGAVLLVCHVTNSNPSRWDIPKGVQETGEEPMDCVMREVEEETGLKNIVLKKEFQIVDSLL